MWGSLMAQQVKNPLQCRRQRTHRFDPWIRRSPEGEKWQTRCIFLPEKSHEQRSLACHGLWGHKELDMTEQLAHASRYYFKTRKNIVENI